MNYDTAHTQRLLALLDETIKLLREARRQVMDGELHDRLGAHLQKVEEDPFVFAMKRTMGGSGSLS